MKRKLTILSSLSILALSSAAIADTPYRTTQLSPTFQPISVSSIDIDSDGMLSRQELRAAMKLFRAQRKAVKKAKHAKRVAALDSNGDGKLSKAERQAGKAARFAKLDANGDGMISVAEAGSKRLGKRFAKIDANGDGFLTKAEIKAGRKGKGKKMRKGKKNRRNKAGKRNRKGKRNRGKLAQ